MLVADFANDLFHQILDRHQAGHAAVFVDHNRHANIVLLHFAQQIAAEFALGYEVNIAPHQRFESALRGFAIGHLQHVLRVNNALDIVDIL